MIRNFSNIFGWRTDRKVVCFECDDWGSIRISNKESKERLLANGIPLNSNYFTKFDTLESDIDLRMLFELVASFEDTKGNHPVITTLNIMGNPDFYEIEKGSFSRYYWQPLAQTYLDYGLNPGLMQETWKEGVQKGFIYPAFHGREHLHVNRWMGGLQQKLPVTMMAFKEGITGLHPQMAREQRKEYQAAFDAETPEDIDFLKMSIPQGLKEFEDYFGFRARYFVPANGFFPVSILPMLKHEGIEYINTPKMGKSPTGRGTYERYFRYLGKRVADGIYYITRNAAFEPSNPIKGEDWLQKCLENIRRAFNMGKPAVIGMHRVNYVGGIDEANRDFGLSQLRMLFSKILLAWPDVEFMSTEQLGDLIKARLVP